MKHYTVPTFLLLAVTGLLLLGILRSFARAGRADAALAAERSDVDQARRELTRSLQAAKAATEQSAVADRFLGRWKPELESDGNIEQIFGQLDTLAVNNLLSPSGKNFAVKSNYFFNGRQLSVQDVNISVAGDFYRTVNWLGAVESAFPLARVEQISYTTNGTSLAMAVQLVFPRRFDTP